LIADPLGELTTLGQFLGFADPADWAGSVAGRVRATAPVAVAA
jgi:putative sulfotransferase